MTKEQAVCCTSVSCCSSTCKLNGFQDNSPLATEGPSPVLCASCPAQEPPLCIPEAKCEGCTNHHEPSCKQQQRQQRRGWSTHKQQQPWQKESRGLVGMLKLQGKVLRLVRRKRVGPGSKRILLKLKKVVMLLLRRHHRGGPLS